MALAALTNSPHRTAAGTAAMLVSSVLGGSSLILARIAYSGGTNNTTALLFRFALVVVVLGAVETIQRVKSAAESVLGNVFGFVGVAQEQIRQAERGLLVIAHQRFEGRRVTPPSTDDQIGVGQMGLSGEVVSSVIHRAEAMGSRGGGHAFALSRKGDTIAGVTLERKQPAPLARSVSTSRRGQAAPVGDRSRGGRGQAAFTGLV